MKLHYALQTCDISSYQNQKRFASNDRSEISKKCIKSFFQSVTYCKNIRPDIEHVIEIFEDHCSSDLKEFICNQIELFSSSNVKINLSSLESVTGISASIRSCYEWLRQNGKDFVYQIQDDYMFYPETIYLMVEIFEQIKNNTGSSSIVSPYNDPHNWLTHYLYQSTPRTVVPGKDRYWIQFYDMSCSFLTDYSTFIKNWDLYELFLYLVDKREGGFLENVTLNQMLVKRGILGLIPVNSLALHMQSEFEKDPYIDWKKRWNEIEI